MTTFTELQMSEQNFWEQFAPIPNHLAVNGSAYNDCMFETYGPELDFVANFDEAHVWTILDCDGHMVIASGFHFVNRFGYLITLHPVPTGTSITVPDEDADLDTEDNA